MGIAPLERPPVRSAREEEAYRALDVVMDPELDEPVTDLGFVRSVEVEQSDAGERVRVHLRLPTSFCSPNFAYLMASDAKDALTALPWAGSVVGELDDPHHTARITAGLAADAGYRGTFRHEAERDLDELRATFRRKAHTAALERCLTAWLRADGDRTEGETGRVRLRDLPASEHTDALLRRREALGLSLGPDDLVLVDADGRSYPEGEVPMALRRARSTRISIDGNAHFCRGLLRTRYEGSGADQTHRADGAEPGDHHHLIPLTVKETHR